MQTVISGPSVVTGNLDPTNNKVPEQGPSLTFQGSGVVDPRFVGNIGVALGSKPIYGFYANPYFALVDAVPQTAAANKIAAAANAASGVAMALATVQAAGITPNIPLVPFGQAVAVANVVKVLALDLGFTTATTVSGSKNITIPAGAWKFFQVGEPIIIGGAGASANLPLITTVAATPAPNATVVAINDAAGQSLSGCPVGSMDPSLATVSPNVMAGTVISLADPAQALCRGVSITGVASGTGGNFIVRGYDLFGQPMSETIAATAGATTVFGKKAFKYIASVTPQFTDAHTYSIGTSDVYGFPVRSDFWEYMQVFWAGAFLTVSTGWTVADGATPTATTGDVRGTMQLGATGGGSGATGSADGTKRLAAFMSLPLYNAIGANNLVYSTMFGQTQFTQ